MRRRNDGSLGAIGWILAVAIVAIGFASARAEPAPDRWSDQELLQSRLDQLAQGPGAPAGQAPLVAGRFARSFLIPGTDTSLRIGGHAVGRVTWYLRGIQPSAALFGNGGGSVDRQEGSGGTGNIQQIPLHLPFNAAYGRSSAFFITGRTSRVFIDARTPTAWGVAQGYAEFDFNNSNNGVLTNGVLSDQPDYTMRLRQAYAALGPFLAGHATGTFTDNDSDMEIIDDGFQIGGTGRARDGQLRYSFDGPWPDISFAIALEQPNSEFTNPLGGFTADTNPVATGACNAATLSPANQLATACLPNFAAFNAAQNREPALVWQGRIDQPWGHVQIGAVLKDAVLSDGRYVDKTWIGYGGAVSGDLKPFPEWSPKDYIGYALSIGEGLGGYIQTTQAVATNFGGTLGGSNPVIVGGMTGAGCAAATPCSFTGTTAREIAARQAYDALVRGRTISAFGAKIGYQHWWTSNVRTNLDFSMVHQDVPTLQGLATAQKQANRELLMTHVNLMWSPVAFVTTGVEYAWGHRVTIPIAKGDSHVIQGLLRVVF